MRVAVQPELLGSLERGQEVVLNESFNIVMARRPETTGEIATIKEVLEDGRRAMIVGRADEHRVVELGKGVLDGPLRSGDSVLIEPRAGIVLERLPRPDVEELVLEEVPDVSYDDVGGLDDQIEQITDAVELPFVHQALFSEYDLPAPKGILLYGPPGCGKSLLAARLAAGLSRRPPTLVSGPEIMDKYVGGSEQQLRNLFVTIPPVPARPGDAEDTMIVAEANELHVIGAPPPPPPSRDPRTHPPTTHPRSPAPAPSPPVCSPRRV
jgi:proteasome-associated ATPase